MMDKELYPSHKKLMKGKIFEIIGCFRRTYKKETKEEIKI